MIKRLLPWLSLTGTLGVMAAMPAGWKIPAGLICIVCSYVLFRMVAANE